jgi:hypothetical protein
VPSTEGDAVPRLSRLAPALAAALALSCLALAVPAAPAAAGTYTVRQCDYASGNGHHDFVWQSAGSPTVDQYVGSACNEFGLAARNSGGGTQRTYPSGAYGGWFAYAPSGTVFTHFSGAFGALEGCCVNGMTSYAEATQMPDGQGGRAYLFQGHLGNNSWYPPSGVQGPVGRSWHSSTSGFDARRVGFHLRCGPGFSCSQGIYGDLRLRGRSFEFGLRDDSAPAVGDPTGTLVAGTWVRGVRALGFPAHDSGGGLASIETAFDSGVVLHSPSECAVVAGRYARLQPCPTTRIGEWTFDTRRLADGGHRLELRATDAGGTTTRRAFSAYVDNTPPGAPRDPAIAGGDTWRARNSFELAWQNPSGQHAPIVRARWLACPAHDEVLARCVGGVRVATDVNASGPIALPTAGEWNVVAWLQDVAGNASLENASVRRRLRFDPDPPALRFLPLDPATPGHFAVEADDLSGIVGGTIELRRFGSDAWIALPTERSENWLAAELDDRRRRAGGAYHLRVRAVDAAGNEGLGDGGVRLIPETVESPGEGPTPAPKGTGPQQTSGASPHRAPAARGERTPTRRARVTMAARAAVARSRPAPRRRARRWGRSARRLAVVGGRPVLFHGRVGRPVPRSGKLVEVQAHFRGRWRTISTVRSRRDGRWRFRYTFRTTGRRAAYRLRARAPVEAGYPFSAGVSRPVRVTVRPDRR